MKYYATRDNYHLLIERDADIVAFEEWDDLEDYLVFDNILALKDLDDDEFLDIMEGEIKDPEMKRKYGTIYIAIIE